MCGARGTDAEVRVLARGGSAGGGRIGRIEALSDIHPELIMAYRNTRYEVLEPGMFTLRVDLPSPELWAAHAELRVRSSAFLTAWNPLGAARSGRVNDRARKRMEKNLRRFEIWRGRGDDPSGDWPGEESALVLGIGLRQAMRVGRKYRQNAIVWAGADAVPRLILLR